MSMDELAERVEQVEERRWRAKKSNMKMKGSEVGERDLKSSEEEDEEQRRWRWRAAKMMMKMMRKVKGSDDAAGLSFLLGIARDNPERNLLKMK
jgi:hypothetical protein